MKAAVLRQLGMDKPYAVSRPLQIEEVELAAPGDNEVVVEVRAAGLCHSDLSLIDGTRPKPVPIVVGHEAAGVVVECGKDVRSLTAGDHVVCLWAPGCGDCAVCRSGMPYLCMGNSQFSSAGTLASGGIRLSKNGQPIHHHAGVAGFAQYAVLPERALVKIDSDHPFDVAAVTGCAVITGAGAVFNTAGVTPGSRVAIVGLGGVGFNALLACKAAGASQIVAVDVHNEKLDLAKKLGATDCCIASTSDISERIRDITRGGADFAFEMAGASRALELAIDATRRGGTVTTASMPATTSRVQVPHLRIVSEQLTIKGCYMGSCVPHRDIPHYLDMFRARALPIDKLIGERLTFRDLNAGFDRLASGQSLRQILRPDL